MKTDMYCYLENRERRTLPSNEAFERWLDPDHSAIVCIDMHRGHVGPDEELTLPAPRARARIPAHNLFHARARELGIPIIHVQHWQRYGGIDGKAIGQFFSSTHFSGTTKTRATTLMCAVH